MLPLCSERLFRNRKVEGGLMRSSDLDLTTYSRMGEVGKAEGRGWGSIARSGGGHVEGYVAHSKARDRYAHEDGTGSVRSSGNSQWASRLNA